MSQQELLKKVLQTLDEAGIQYMVTGSIGSSLQGEPHLNNEITPINDTKILNSLNLL